MNRDDTTPNRSMRQTAAELGICVTSLWKRRKADAQFAELCARGAPITALVQRWNVVQKNPEPHDPELFDRAELNRRKAIAVTERAEADARIKKAEAAEIEGSLLDLGTVDAVIGRACGIIKNKLLGVPSLFRNHLAGFHRDSRECAELEAILDGLLRDALGEMSEELLKQKIREAGK